MCTSANRRLCLLLVTVTMSLGGLGCEILFPWPTPPADTTAPTTPTGLMATAASATQVDLTWSASTDTGGAGVAGYRVFRDGTQITTVTATMYSDTGRTADTPYCYVVAAIDAANNVSADSAQSCVTTLAVPPPPGPVYNNTTDPTNAGARYIGERACASCHTDVGARHEAHGHAFKLRPIQGVALDFPASNPVAGVPNPPSGRAWTDLRFMIGGFFKKARFIDASGHVMTDGTAGVNTQWNLAMPHVGLPPAFGAYEASRTTPLPYDFDCFQCHTTGPKNFADSGNQYQFGLPGMPGTWAESGIQCEACHGPGSNHPANPSARDLYVDVRAQACATCHRRGTDFNVVPASGGYIQHREQLQELLASGGHATLDCVMCHEPHTSTLTDPNKGIRKTCTECHPTRTMGIHTGATYTRLDGYSEVMNCQSCHMSFAVRNGRAAAIGATGKAADERTHIVRINTTSATSAQALFNMAGTAVQKDAQGRAAITVDFVCMRCHAGVGNAPALPINVAAGVMDAVHSLPQQP